MELSTPYILIITLVPFIAIVVAGWYLGAVPDTSVIGKILNLIAEPDLPDLMKKNGFPGIKTAVFQIVRLLFTAVVGLMITWIFGLSGTAAVISIVIIFVLCYKFIYILLVYRDKQRITKLNIALPYTIKSIAYLASVFPVNNAMIKAIDLVPKVFREDIAQLCRDVDEDPTSFAPYQAFIDRYDGRLNRLDYYLKTLFRMSRSSSKEETKLLANLNETISEEMSNARKMKNKAINDTVAYLGMIPVALLTAMLLFLMIQISTAI